MSLAGSPWRAATGQGRDWIAAHIPHQGRMCLLDAVLSASDEGIECRALDLCAPDHPMRRTGRLGAACGIECAAQAMALHGALAARAQGRALPARGLLVSVRGVRLHVARLDGSGDPVRVRVRREADNGDHCAYEFVLDREGAVLVDGRAVVMLDPAEGRA